MEMALEARFERYCDVMVAAMQHADREQPGRWYLKGLVLPRGRKSVEPMAARVQPQRVRSAHQSMHHLVAEAHWSDEALLARLREGTQAAGHQYSIETMVENFVAGVERCLARS